VKALLLSLFFITSCTSEPRMTGYKYGGNSYGSDKVLTCVEEDIANNWWSFDTKNAIVNTLVPGYADLCVHVGDTRIYFWDEVSEGGTYQDNWNWYCADHNTMKVIDIDSGEVYVVTMFGKDANGCYDIETSGAGITVRGDVCPCDDPFEE